MLSEVIILISSHIAMGIIGGLFTRTNDYEEFEEKLKTIEQDHQERERELHDLSDENDSLELENEKLSEENEELMEKLEELQAENSELREKIEALEGGSIVNLKIYLVMVSLCFVGGITSIAMYNYIKTMMCGAGAGVVGTWTARGAF